MMRVLKSLFVLLAVLAATFVGGPSAQAQSEADKTTARQLAIEAQQALEKKDYATAADRFGRAEALYHAPTLLVGLGRAYVGLGKYVEAMESYNKVIREKLPENATDAFLQAKADAKAEIEGLDKKIAWVTLRVEGADAPNATLDETAIPTASLDVKRAVNPGDHVFRASAEGFATAEQPFSIASGESQTVTLTLVPGEPGPGDNPLPKPIGGGDDGPDQIDEGTGGTSTLAIVGWTAIGVGGAGLILGAITGGLAVSKHGTLTDACDDNRCAPEQQSTLDSFHALATVSTIGFIAGGVLAAAGTVLVIVAPSDDVSAEVGLGSVRATVRF